MTLVLLRLLLDGGKGLRVQFRERFSPDIEKDLSAFANSKGGYLLIGVYDNGIINGQRLCSALKTEIRTIAANCSPAVVIEKISEVGAVIAVKVSEGRAKPYACSSGFYHRLDSSTQKWENPPSAGLFSAEPGLSFEEQVCQQSTLENISNRKISDYFLKTGQPNRKFEIRHVLQSLNLGSGSVFYNAAVLLFGAETAGVFPQCRIALRVYQGTDKSAVSDSSEIVDDLISQYTKAMTFLENHLKVPPHKNLPASPDAFEIPRKAFQEALVNALVHRDYSLQQGHVSVEIFTDRVTVTSPGGVMHGAVADGSAVVPVRRNPIIAEVFNRLGLIGSAGTGIRAIRTACAALPHEPVVVSGEFFAVTLFRNTRRSPLNRPLIISAETAGARKAVPPDSTLGRGIKTGTVRKIANPARWH